MATSQVILVVGCLSFIITSEAWMDDNSVLLVERGRSLPKGFIFATSTAAYQIEGAWNASGKGENIWDRMVHTNPGFIKDGSNGDTACDSYNLYKDDIKLIKDIGFRMYRFSISWARVLPDGTTRNINEPGLKYYDDLIDELIRQGIAPMVTLYHWDLPVTLQEMGGWLNHTIVDYFQDYADLIFARLGNKVKWWITINEPRSIVDGYGSDGYAPALNLTGVGDYMAGHNLLRAHAKVYRLYKAKYQHQGGKLSITLDSIGAFPKNSSDEEDLRSCERLMQFNLGWFAHPIYSTYGDYPPVMRYLIDNHSAREGRNFSRLPYFTVEEIEEIRGTFDFFALNHYTSKMCTTGKQGRSPSWHRDTEVETYSDQSWPSSQSSWLKVVPEGFRKLLNWIKVEYNDPEIFVTENGFSDYNILDDQGRINYLKGYLSEMEKAIYEDGCNVAGYTIWSVIDNFEWRAGYTERFGLVHVDFESPGKNRTKKASATFIKDYIEANSVRKISSGT
uniref:beta-glucosidase n=1 Tax=Lygus hesperus TaxID=30085 RepID=A0A146L9N2_LYGHE